MNPIIFAMRHPITMMVGIVSVVLFSILALANILPDHITVAGHAVPIRSVLPPRTGMPVDIFPDLNTPIIYVAQPYGRKDDEGPRRTSPYGTDSRASVGAWRQVASPATS